MDRSGALQAFVDALSAALDDAQAGPDVSRVSRRLFSSLDRAFPAGRFPSCQRNVCRYLPEVLSLPGTAGPSVKELGRCFSEIEPGLRWLPRPSSGPHASGNWAEGHANAMIIGPGGLEDRDDVAIGVSLMAPHVRYPDHSHGPEEIYLVMTPGRFQHGDSGWFSPGRGGTLHNVPNIRHAMASDDVPFLAFWCLLLKDDATG